jgi:HdeA/HdeB family
MVRVASVCYANSTANRNRDNEPDFFSVAALVLLVASSACAASAQQAMRNIEQYKCKDVMRESGADRDVAIAFLHGFLLDKSGHS